MLTSHARSSVYADPAAMHPADTYASVQKRHLDYTVELPSGSTRDVRVRYSREQTALVRRVYYAMGSQVDEWIGRWPSM